MNNLVLHYIIISIIIGIIIYFQILLYSKNKTLLKKFQHIFTEVDNDKFDATKFSVQKDATMLVSGIETSFSGNTILSTITNSINRYLSYNKGAVTDFLLLKDIVDRNCDSCEVEIATLTPLPLYLGLVGTMAGIIAGIIFIWITGGLSDLSTNGIMSLLGAVGLAMTASIVGIILTTGNSYKYKNCKRSEEETKNDFLSWMQVNILPELSTDSSQVLMKTVKQLSHFNREFAQITEDFKNSIAGVSESYKEQTNLIDKINELNLVEIAQANVMVLHQFNECIPYLQTLNQYLQGTDDYLRTVKQLNEQFSQELGKTQVLENISTFLKDEIEAINQRKAFVSQAVCDVDDKLSAALGQLGEKAEEEMIVMKNQFVKQEEAFNVFLLQMQEDFKKTNNEIQNTLTEKLKETPQIVDNLKEVSDIPNEVKKIIDTIEKSNANIKRDILLNTNSNSETLNKMLEALETISHNRNNGEETINKIFPMRTKLLFIACCILVMITCIIVLIQHIYRLF